MRVLLDLGGVLLNSERMEPAYRDRLARWLAARHGGTVEEWRRAHDVAYEWYKDPLGCRETWTQGTWAEVVDRADAENLVRMFREAGREPPKDPLPVARALEFEVMAGIDAAFPDARHAIHRLRRRGHPVHVASNATESNARGSLTGAGLLDSVDGVLTGERLNASKGTPEYWRRAMAVLQANPSDVLLVDDRLEYLEAAASCGIRALLLDRKGVRTADALPESAQALLQDLATLPRYVDLLAARGPHGGDRRAPVTSPRRRTPT